MFIVSFLIYWLFSLLIMWIVILEWAAIVASLSRKIRNGCVSFNACWSFAAHRQIDDNANAKNLHHIRNHDARIFDDRSNIFGPWSHMVGDNIYGAIVLERGGYCRLPWQWLRHCTKFLRHHFRFGKHFVIHRRIRFHIYGWHTNRKSSGK